MSHSHLRPHHRQHVDIVRKDDHDSDDDIVGSYLDDDLDFLSAWSSMNTNTKGMRNVLSKSCSRCFNFILDNVGTRLVPPIPHASRTYASTFAAFSLVGISGVVLAL